MKTLTRFQAELLKEYKRTQKQLRMQLKRKNAPEVVKAIIEESIKELTERHARIIARYIYRDYKKGLADAKRELKGVNIEAAAPIPDMGSVGMDLSEVSQQQMNRIMHHNLGAIGNYNIEISKTLQHQYNVLLSDNKLLKSLDTTGWTPWLEGEWKKRGIAPEIIKLVKGQKTSKQMISILEMQGIQGGKHPNDVARMLVPHVNRFFGPEGVSINNIGKTVKRFRIDADGNYGWFDHKITKIYKATPRTYSRLIARDTLRQARMDAYYDSLKSSKLVDHYISVAHMDSNTCAHCAMMHGQIVTKGSGPQYHGNCGCDLRPVWKKDSPLASQNKPDAFFEKQRDMHFLRMNDLKRYNAKMPRGTKLKYATQLPEDAITKVIPGKADMRAIRHEMLGKPVKIAPTLKIQKVVQPISKGWTFTDTEWKREAGMLYAKTKKDGKEHLLIFNEKTHEFVGGARGVTYDIPPHPFSSLHTHPNWDSPLSGQDISVFLSESNEIVSGATSNKNIYLVRKLGDTRTIAKSGAAQKYISKIFEEERTKTLTMYGHGPYTEEQMRVAIISANKVLAQKYKFEYKIITL